MTTQAGQATQAGQQFQLVQIVNKYDSAKVIYSGKLANLEIFNNDSCLEWLFSYPLKTLILLKYNI